jgi:hypothetical protein
MGVGANGGEMRQGWGVPTFFVIFRFLRLKTGTVSNPKCKGMESGWNPTLQKKLEGGRGVTRPSKFTQTVRVEPDLPRWPGWNRALPTSDSSGWEGGGPYYFRRKEQKRAKNEVFVVTVCSESGHGAGGKHAFQHIRNYGV